MAAVIYTTNTPETLATAYPHDFSLNARKELKLAEYRIECEWKGRSASFVVAAYFAVEASELGHKHCKKAVGMPPSSVFRCVHLGDAQPRSGQADRSILKRAADEIMYKRSL